MTKPLSFLRTTRYPSAIRTRLLTTIEKKPHPLASPWIAGKRTPLKFMSLIQRPANYSGDIILSSRQYSSASDARGRFGGNYTTLLYTTSVAIFVLGLSYAAVPLYRMFCQATGYGGTVSIIRDIEKVETMQPIKERELTIRFNADTSSKLRWRFKPHQAQIKVVPGETALAFYTATNTSDQPVTGIATYNVIPFEAGQYFHKVQCFCFEEQRLNPSEQVDMPVFFYIDPEFDEDPGLYKVETITLSYTFFESRDDDNFSQ